MRVSSLSGMPGLSGPPSSSSSSSASAVAGAGRLAWAADARAGREGACDVRRARVGESEEDKAAGEEEEEEGLSASGSESVSKGGRTVDVDLRGRPRGDLGVLVDVVGLARAAGEGLPVGVGLVCGRGGLKVGPARRRAVLVLALVGRVGGIVIEVPGTARWRGGESSGERVEGNLGVQRSAGKVRSS